MVRCVEFGLVADGKRKGREETEHVLNMVGW